MEKGQDNGCEANGITPTELFTQYKRQAWKLAAHFARKYGMPYGEVKDEAEHGLALAAVNWHNGPRGVRFNPNCATQNTWMYKLIYYHLLTWATRKQDRARPFSSYGDGGGGPGHPLARKNAPTAFLDRLLREIGGDAKVVVTTLLFAPAEFMEELYPRGWSEKAERVRTELLSALDWCPERFEKAWAEVEAAL